jgi:hypothetical protein
MTSTETFDKTDFQESLKRYLNYEKKVAEARKMRDRKLENTMRGAWNLLGWKIKDILDAFPDEARAAADEIGLDIE